jgi:hypothetical protein
MELICQVGKVPRLFFKNCLEYSVGTMKQINHVLKGRASRGLNVKPLRLRHFRLLNSQIAKILNESKWIVQKVHELEALIEIIARETARHANHEEQ